MKDKNKSQGEYVFPTTQVQLQISITKSNAATEEQWELANNLSYKMIEAANDFVDSVSESEYFKEISFSVVPHVALPFNP